jgi:putative transposase
MAGARVQVDGHWLKLERLDTWINMAEELRFAGRITSVTISETAGHWYVSINVEVEPPEHEHPQESIGVDLGLQTLVMLSDGTQFENQKLTPLKKVSVSS